ncbi:hypothetical protein [Caproicibacter sp. BJN0012]|uniref:hypothetical protein n=1 Tax=Caproicibacter sp. BJN0012 TaxID=3110227 RepID=UPI002E12636A
MQNEQNPFTDPDLKQYFSSLPSIVQESIEQSGVKFESLSQLKSFAEGMIHKT